MGRQGDYPPRLIVHFDGACLPCNPGGTATYGWTISSEEGEELACGRGVGRRGGTDLSTNNVAEYCAIGFALSHLDGLGWRGHLTACGDSLLVINQITGKYECKSKLLQPLLRRCLELLSRLCGEDYALLWVPRSENERCDQLSLAAYRGSHPG